MSKNNTPSITPEQVQEAIVALIDKGEFELDIPDDKLESKFRARVAALEARVNHLTMELLKLRAASGDDTLPEAAEAEAEEPVGRFDVNEKPKAKAKGKK